MTSTRTPTPSPLGVAKNRLEEASRVVDAYKIQLGIRTRTATHLHGAPSERDAWARVGEAEAQLEAAEVRELRASQDVAWEERRNAQARQARAWRGR